MNVSIFLTIVCLGISSLAQAGDTKLTVDIHTAEKFKNTDLSRLNQAKQYIQVAINSEAFKNRVLNFTY